MILLSLCVIFLQHLWNFKLHIKIYLMNFWDTLIYDFLESLSSFVMNTILLLRSFLRHRKNVALGWGQEFKRFSKLVWLFFPWMYIIFWRIFRSVKESFDNPNFCSLFLNKAHNSDKDWLVSFMMYPPTKWYIFRQYFQTK